MLGLAWKSAPLGSPREAAERFTSALALEAAALEPVVERDEDQARIGLHPAAGPIVVRVEGDRIVLEADTGTAGPGYHEEAVRCAERAAESAAIVWSAGREPFDRARVEAELDAWLARTAADILTLAGRGAVGFGILLPEGVEYAHEGVVATPLGPRDRRWLERVAQGSPEGRDVFAWWDAGLGAGYFAGLARVLAWTEARWRAPVDDRERALLDRIVTAIERAHGLEPSMELPWIEAAEIYELLGESSLRATRAGVLADAARGRGARSRIGYRRGPVRLSLSGGWSLVVPGELAERWEERGTWVGWDRTRTVWMSSLTAEGTRDTEAVLAGLPEIAGEGDVLRMERGPIVGHARFAIEEEDGRRVVVMRAHAACGPHVALGTIILPEDADRTWALETWGTLDREDGGETPS